MNPVVIVLSAFVLSVGALLVFIWSMRSGALAHDAAGATVIFPDGVAGQVEEPAATTATLQTLQQEATRQTGNQPRTNPEELRQRAEADRSTAPVVRLFFISAVVWLVLGSLAGVIASAKLHAPDWLVSSPLLTFGRIRTVHLNVVIYGWSVLAGGGLGIWLIPRLLKTPLRGGGYARMGCVLWNVALAVGVVSVALGYTTGLEWLELPRFTRLTLVLAASLMAVPLMVTIRHRTVEHLYVSVWYLGLAMLSFPVLYVVATLPRVHFGMQEAAMNWWYAHSVLGYVFTPLALASIYYFVPKVIGRPVYSYNLSLLAFWTLAFFYGQLGMHHLIGSPVPGWLVTLSIVQGVMMSIPVAAFLVNQIGTMRGSWGAVRHSPTLAFMVLAGLMYILASFEGSAEGIRRINTVTHFTHFTVAHAHLGNYAFVSVAYFGGMYFALPRVTEREWPFPSLIRWHFWLILVGLVTYIVGLSIGGWLQGMAMLDAGRPFLDSVQVTLPWLKARTLGGSLMTGGHLVFAFHVFALIYRLGPERQGAADLHPARHEVAHV
jgi:cytochrome c oxidase cbb3-type subunit 1